MFKNITDYLLHNRPAKDAPKYIPVGDPITRYGVIVTTKTNGSFCVGLFHTKDVADICKRDYENSNEAKAEVFPMVQCKEMNSRVR